MSSPDGTRPRAPAAEPPCMVPGCGALSERSLALAEARKVFPALPEGRRAHLCRAHYKEWKKGTKMERELQRPGW